eukprot:1079762-Rhodomonas_salina.1
MRQIDCQGADSDVASLLAISAVGVVATRGPLAGDASLSFNLLFPFVYVSNYNFLDMAREKTIGKKVPALVPVWCRSRIVRGARHLQR